MFPGRHEEELRAVVEKGADINEAIDSLLLPPSTKIKKDEDVISLKFESLRGIPKDVLHQISMFLKFVGTKSGDVG